VFCAEFKRVYIYIYVYIFQRWCNGVYNSRAQLLRFVSTRTTSGQSCRVAKTALIWLLATRWRSIKLPNHMAALPLPFNGCFDASTMAFYPLYLRFSTRPTSAVGYLQFAFDLFHQLSLNFIKF